jgi:hypothetical protein
MIKMKKYITKRSLFIVAVIIIALVAGCVALNVYNENKYEKNMKSAYNDIVVSEYLCETLSSLTETTWHNAIYGTYDTYNQGHLDFDSALASMASDQTVIDSKSEIGMYSDKIDTTMKSLKNPPSKYADTYNELLTLYGDYKGIENQAIYPSGSYMSYTADTNSMVGTFTRDSNMISVKLPE